MNITVIWFFTPLVLLIFLFKRGWRAMPRWQKFYVYAAVVVFPIMLALDFDFIPTPDAGVAFYAMIVMFWAYMVCIWWGVIVAVAQLWSLALSPKPT